MATIKMTTAMNKDSPSTRSSDRKSVDCERVELLWEDREEKQIRIWRDQAVVRSQSHAKKASHFKHMHYSFGMTSIALPFAGTIVSTVFLTGSKQIAPILLATTTLVQGMNTMFNFGQKAERHSDYSNRYSELETVIDKELVKPRSMRIACDVFMEHVTATLGRLAGGAPDL